MGVGRAIRNSPRLQAVFTKAQQRTASELSQSIGECQVDGVFTNMSWSPARWHSILNALSKLVTLVTPLLLFLAMEAGDAASRAHAWAATRLATCTYENLLHIGFMTEAMLA